MVIGTTKSGEAGTEASVEDIGDELQGLLNFIIPAGPTGPTGPAGPAGAASAAIAYHSAACATGKRAAASCFRRCRRIPRPTTRSAKIR